MPLRSNPGRIACLAGLAAVVIACAALSIAVGSLPIPLDQVISAFTDTGDSDADIIVTELRLPRTEIGLLVGAALGIAGALMQGLTRNPIAEPGILGINAGAAFAVVIAIFALGVDSTSQYAWFALVGAGVAATAVYLLGSDGHAGAVPAKLALAGAVVAALFVALTSAVLVFDDPTLDQFRFWVVGSLAGRDQAVLSAVLPFLIAGTVLAAVAARWINAIALGDDMARSLGQRLRLTRALATAAFVLLAGGSVAAAGPIAFVGLIVPHLARAAVGADYRWLIPCSALLGAAILLASDVVGRIVVRPAELEVGIVTALIGAPVFIGIVRRQRLVAP